MQGAGDTKANIKTSVHRTLREHKGRTSNQEQRWGQINISGKDDLGLSFKG